MVDGPKQWRPSLGIFYFSTSCLFLICEGRESRSGSGRRAYACPWVGHLGGLALPGEELSFSLQLYRAGGVTEPRL